MKEKVENLNIAIPRITLHYIETVKLAAIQPKHRLLFCLGNLFKYLSMTACLFFEY